MGEKHIFLYIWICCKKSLCYYLGSDLDGGGVEFELLSPPFSVAIVAIKGEDWDGDEGCKRDFDSLV